MLKCFLILQTTICVTPAKVTAQQNVLVENFLRDNHHQYLQIHGVTVATRMASR